MAVQGARQGEGAALEQDARRWLRAYPRRWRRRREDEVLALLADLAEPGATRLDARERWALLRGGLTTRWRTRPPLGAWLLYRTFDRRIPRPWADWAADDVDGFWYPARAYLGAVWWFALLWLVPLEQPGFLWFFVLGALVSQVIAPTYKRRQARLKHVVLRAGDPHLPGSWGTAPGPRGRVDARSGTTWIAVLLGSAAAAGVTGAALGRVAIAVDPLSGDVGFEILTGPLTTTARAVWLVLLAVGGVVGLVAAGIVRRRLSGLRELPAQPDREVRPLSLSGRAGLVLVALATVALGVVEAVGGLVVGAAPVLGSAALVLLPGALVAAQAARRAPLAPGQEVAGVDLWRAAIGAELIVDRPVEVAFPLPDPERGRVAPTGGLPGRPSTTS